MSPTQGDGLSRGTIRIAPGWRNVIPSVMDLSIPKSHREPGKAPIPLTDAAYNFCGTRRRGTREERSWMIEGPNGV